MKWTKEKPTADGYYWVYSNNKSQIVIVENCGHSFATVTYFDCDSAYYLHEFDCEPNCKWSGPIPEPED